VEGEHLSLVSLSTESSLTESSFFFLIKCKNCIDQKEQDKLAIQAGNQQYKSRTSTGRGNRLP